LTIRYPLIQLGLREDEDLEAGKRLLTKSAKNFIVGAAYRYKSARLTYIHIIKK